MSETGEPIRAFIALNLPEGLLAAVGRWQGEALGALRGLRPAPPEALHITLAFLGDRTGEEVERTAAVMRSIDRMVPLRLHPAPVGVPAGRPRVLALGVESDAAVALQRELAARLAEAGLFEPETRLYWPHLSIARLRGRAALGRLPPLIPEGLGTANAVRVALYRSQLRTQGARYRSLAAIDLPQKAADEVI